MEAEATARIGAEWGEWTDTRTAWRNGHREKTLTTQAGDAALDRLRAGARPQLVDGPRTHPPSATRSWTPPGTSISMTTTK
ncbi:transposase [Streptomyces sp. NPDC059650]|uniref:transposase n=1 Tax=Streptomyces sp. NPDC059650 TaxID=3346896 RepID=UPI0036AFDA8C